MADDNQAIEWYLARDGQQHGPINETELQKVIEFGYLKPTDLVWRQGMADWAPAATTLPQTLSQSTAAQAAATPTAATSTPAAMESVVRPGDPAEPAAPHVRLEPEPAPAPAVASTPRPADPVVRTPHHPAPQSAHPAPQSAARDGRGPSHGSGGPYRNAPAEQPSGYPHPHQPSGQAGPAPNPAGAMQPGGQFRGYPQPQPYPHPGPQGPQRPHASQAGHLRQPEPAPQWDARPGRGDGPSPGSHPSAAQPHLQRSPSGQPGPQRGPVTAEPVEDERRGFPWRTAAVLVVLAGLGGGAFALHKSGQLAALPFLGAPETSGTVPVVSAPAGSAKDLARTNPQPAFSGSTGSVDQGLQRSPLWQRLKRDFPDWYQEQVGEVGRLSGESRDDREIGAAMTKAVVELRRKHHAEALAAGPGRLKIIAASFVDNLTRLSRLSTAACYGFISQGESSPAVVELRTPDNKAALDAQLVIIFDAVAEGRKAPQRHEQPRREDYDLLTAELAKRGWTAADLQLFSDARALARAAPEKVCQMVQDWFTAQLSVKDEGAQIRLLGEALKPVVAG